MLASVIGVRPNAIAIDVPRVTRSVASAACSSCRNGSCWVSPVQTPGVARRFAGRGRGPTLSNPPPSGAVDQHVSSVRSSPLDERGSQQRELAGGEAVREHVGLEAAVLGAQPGEHLAHGLGVGGHEPVGGRHGRCPRPAVGARARSSSSAADVCRVVGDDLLVVDLAAARARWRR